MLCALIGEHLSDLRVVFDEFYRILKPGGRLVFSVYHPEMSAAGIEANFEREGVEYRLGAIHYSVAEHFRLLQEARFEEIQVYEFRGDEKLIESVPAAAKYLGVPILLVVKAEKGQPMFTSAGSQDDSKKRIGGTVVCFPKLLLLQTSPWFVTLVRGCHHLQLKGI